MGASTNTMGSDMILQSSELQYLEYNGAGQVSVFGSAVQKIVQSPRSISIIWDTQKDWREGERDGVGDEDMFVSIPGTSKLFLHAIRFSQCR